MARRTTPLEESPAWDIFHELKRYSLTAPGVPNQNAFWENVFSKLGYGITRGGYDYWYYRLRVAGWITTDPVTGATMLKDLELREKA